MIAYEEALELFSKISPIEESEKVRLEEALGRILKEDLHAPCDLPLFNNSAMDGVALRAHELHTDVMIEGTRLAKAVHDPFDDLKTKAIRIMTGAKVPPWADLVVPVEFTEVLRKKEGKDVIKFAPNSFKKGDNIRVAGEDYKKGELIFKKGHCLTADRLMVLANFGMSQINVVKTPKIWLATTGDEVRDPGDLLRSGEIYNSSGIYLKSKLCDLHLPLYLSRHLKDRKEATRSFLIRWIRSPKANLLITTGAVSMGEKDDLPKLAEEMGATIHFHKVAIRPGKPILFASFGKDHYWIGAPGNAISTAVAWTFFIRPFLHQWLSLPLPHQTQALLAQDFRKPEGVKVFFRGFLESKQVHLFAHQGSSHVKASALGNVFVELDRDKKMIPEGSKVLCTFFN
ncbi:MAG: molybdopterin molybdotransferase MoeA [Deltaproteobacteria bacterium]|nr:molybdopterin molybdotransferase MoeA [Deltaproteobacteria bacterium]MBI3016962.1 molybdopterin molybdotransferase MoeA [Deltaproteobacteria bacterium]